MRLLWAVALVALVGCRSGSPTVDALVPMHVVINEVKADLKGANGSRWLASVPASEDAVCKSPDGRQVVIVSVDEIRLGLKTVRATELSPTAGFESPLGVLSIDPTYSASVLRAGATSVDISLKPVPGSQNPVPFPSTTQQSPPLFAAIADVANEILKVDHAALPCLQPTKLKAAVLFDVVRKTTEGVTFKIVGLKLGNKRTSTDEMHQVLEFSLGLEGSSQAYTPATQRQALLTPD